LHGLHQLYALGEEIGSGGYGKVHRATCKATKIDVAIKIVPEGEHNGCLADDIKEEINVMGQMRHPHIARLNGYFLEGGSYHLVIDLCKGGDLTSVLKSFRATSQQPGGVAKRQGIPTSIVTQYIWQMLDGLAYLHACGFIHRDIKPDNFLLETKDITSDLKLIDFGFACPITPSRKLTRVVGTASYVSPEMLRGSYDQSSDVWSLGATCYAACTDTLPFDGDTRKDYLSNVKRGNLSIADEEWMQHPPELKAFVLSMLSNDPAKRPTATELQEECKWLKMAGALRKEPACCTIC
jgi:serine/threonine protein kinase